MAHRTKGSCHRLTFEDAILIWRLRWNGELQSRIAARLDVNQGRISEVLRGKLHTGSEAVARGLEY